MGNSDGSSQLYLLTPQEVADALKVSRRRVYDWINEGDLDSAKVNGRHQITEVQLADKLGPKLAAEIVRPRGRDRSYTPPPPKYRYDGEDRNELLTTKECQFIVAKKIGSSESSYYKHLHPVIKGEMIGQGAQKRIRKGELMDLIHLIWYFDAEGAFPLWGSGNV